MKSEMEELKTQMDWAKSNPTWILDDFEDLNFDPSKFREEEEEVRMDKKPLTKKKAKSNLNVSNISDNRSVTNPLNQGFIDKSRIDTSNVIMDDGSILGGMQLNRSNISTYQWSRWRGILAESRKEGKMGEQKPNGKVRIIEATYG